MRKVLLLLVLTIMLLSAMAPMVQALGGAYCEAARASGWTSWSLDAGCVYEIVMELTFAGDRPPAG